MTEENKIVFGKLDQMRNDKIFKENRIPIGFIGGGDNSFIGYTHRLAARFDNRFICVAGVFSRDSKNIWIGKIRIFECVWVQNNTKIK